METSRMHIAAGLRPVSQTRRDGPSDRPEVLPFSPASGVCALQLRGRPHRTGEGCSPRAEEPTAPPRLGGHTIRTHRVPGSPRPAWVLRCYLRTAR